MSKAAQNARENLQERPCRACDRPILKGQRMVPWSRRTGQGRDNFDHDVRQWQHVEHVT